MTIEVGAGGGGLLKLVAFDSGQTASGLTGTILSVTAGAGQFLKITYLSTASGTVNEANMTLETDNNPIFTNGVLTDADPSATNAIGSGFGISSHVTDTFSSIAYGARLLNNSELCTSFSLTKVSGTTSVPIQFAYQTLEKLT